MINSEEVEEVIKEAETNGSLPEAPASATVRVYIDGYSTLLTMRGDKVKKVVEELEFIVKYAKEKGWKTSWRTETEQEQKYCATCNQPAEEKRGTSKQGKPYHGIFCSSGDKTHTVWL